MSALVWLNGILLSEESCVGISPSDRGFTLGDGVFETIRVSSGIPLYVEHHLERLRIGCSFLQIPINYRDHELLVYIGETITANGLSEAVVRITVTRGTGRRGVLPPTNPEPTIVISASPHESHLLGEDISRVNLIVSSVARNNLSPTSRIKSCNYLDNILARMEASEKGAYDAVMLNTNGEVACTTSANVFIVQEGRLITPPPSAGVLNGTVRRVLLDRLCHRLGLFVIERKVSLQDLLSADEVFITNSVIGVLGVDNINGNRIGKRDSGEITLDIRRELEKDIDLYKTHFRWQGSVS